MEIAKFRERVSLISQYVSDKEMKKDRYHDMLKDEIREFVSMSSYKTLDDMIPWAYKQEIDLETVKKIKPV